MAARSTRSIRTTTLCCLLPVLGAVGCAGTGTFVETRSSYAAVAAPWTSAHVARPVARSPAAVLTASYRNDALNVRGAVEPTEVCESAGWREFAAGYRPANGVGAGRAAPAPTRPGP
jgi:hypothetical protein